MKCEGALALKANDSDLAMKDWQIAHQKDTNDAEALIYQEDLRVLKSQQQYITFVVGSILTGDAVSIGRDFLQGAYVAQYLHNHSNKSPQIYLLVANFGSIARQYTHQAVTIETSIAQQIVNLIQKDIQNSSSSLHIKGMVLGLPFIDPNVIKILNQSGVPVVLSGSFSDEELQGSTNIFPVAVSTEREGLLGAIYVKQKFPNSNIAVFENGDDPYSKSLASSFIKQFSTAPIVESFPSQNSNPNADLQSNGINLIYFAGNSVDINGLLPDLPANTNVHVMGGSALYQLGGYAGTNYSRLLFTSFAFPDEWGSPPRSDAPPIASSILQTYPQSFAGTQPRGVYGYVRPDSDVLLSTDALTVLAQSSVTVSNDGSDLSFSPASLINALNNISGANAFQGFSGLISFGADRASKAAVVLSVSDKGLTHMDTYYGCLQTTPCSPTA